MNRIALAAVCVLLTLSQAGTFTQGTQPPTLATDITAAEVQAVINAPTGGGDRQMKVVDMGKYNVSVGVLRRGQTKPGAPVGAINHEHVTEVYYIVSGSGTLLTGGTVDGVKPLPARRRDREGGGWSQQPGHVPPGGADTQGRPWRYRHHPGRRVSRLHRRCRSRGLRVGPAGSGSRATRGVRSSAFEEVEVEGRHARTSRHVRGHRRGSGGWTFRTTRE